MSAQKADRNRDILRYYEMGYTQDLIARNYGISRPRVTNIIKQNGGNRVVRLASRNRRIRELWMSGLSPAEIAKDTGLGVRRIREIVKEG